MLDYLHQGLTDKPLSAWDGQTLGMNAPGHAPIALWRMMTTRWICVLNDMASEHMLGRLVAFLQDTLQDTPCNTPRGMLSELSHYLLRNAQFLEQNRWQAAVLRHVLASTESLVDVSQALASVRILALVPVEYCSRQHVSILAPRLWCLDAHLMQEHSLLTAHGRAASELKLLLRRWWTSFPHTMKLSTTCLTDYVDMLLSMPWDPLASLTQELYENSSISLLQVLLPHCDDASVPMEKWMSIALANEPGGKRYVARHVMAEILEFAVEIKPRWFSFSAPMASSLDWLKMTLMVALEPIRTHSWAPVSPLEQAFFLRVLSAQIRCLPQDSSVDELATMLSHAIEFLCASVREDCSLAERLAPLAHSLFTCATTLGPMLHEKHYFYVTCAFVSFSAAFCDKATQLTPLYLSVLAKMDTQSFESTLNAIASLFESDSCCFIHELSSFLHVLCLMLEHAPAGTSHASSRCISALLLCLTTLAMKLPALTRPIVDWLSCVCQHRARVLRPFDVPRILALVGTLLGPCASTTRTDACTDAPWIFRGICAALRSIVRQRKDLVTPCLPHLTDILSQQLRLLSHMLRAHPGLAILRRIHASTPCWIDIVEHPLGVTEAQAFRRLLTELEGKTSVASLGVKRARTETRSITESLAKPMSKYAVYIMVAYVRCVTMPDTTITAALRQELQPGMFALCNMCGDFERDAALKSMLDAAGQLVFKSIWTQWDAQRYKGA